ncbi:DUF998 domain-containing protein [Pseudonocardia sp. KRD291]|uniref:DUF998 domain-containing protein n=1 Tax=Pseudonocardia sp. KRD291 TaxID=2792007 RepID=UPI001C49EBBD|nr:DUF998 domain-containing protein [Pseudonocardia sp. KRD291]MBW0102596.1 DUF998 domain-containing protein [Pseudonocardia sp. KRD291]
MDGRGPAGTAEEQQGTANTPAGRTPEGVAGGVAGAVTGAVAGVVAAGVAVAGTAVLALHAIGATTVDPVALTVSDYVAVPGGAALLGLAAAGLVTAGVALVRAAPRCGWPRPVAVLLALWCVALVLVAVFPTHAVGAAPDLASVVHRWAGAVVFAVPPVAGLLATRGPGGAAARAAGLARWSAGTGVAALAFLASHAPAVLAGAPPFPLLGLVERLAYLAMLGMVVVFGRAAAPAAAPAAAAATVPAIPAVPGAGPAPVPSTPPAVTG